ncbi:MAG: universal stress protein [Rhodocyclaceae bacterium]|nr:universal stress protein [Rhodocyclaceae bacterium]
MKLLVATDGSSASDKALEAGIKRARETKAELIVAHVIEPFYPLGVTEFDVAVFEEAMRKEAEAILSAAASRAQQAGVSVRTISEVGSPADTLIEIVKREGVDEVFIASHGRHGLARLTMGSVSSRVVEWAPCTVTVVK